MARTHAAQPRSTPTSRFHQEEADGGVLLGKGGEPIPTTPTRGISTLNPHGTGVVHLDDGELIPAPAKPEPPAPVEYEWLCDRTTWQRNMDGWQALHLLNAMINGMFGQELSVVLSDAEVRKLPPDTRWHWRKRVKAVVPAEEPTDG